MKQKLWCQVNISNNNVQKYESINLCKFIYRYPSCTMYCKYYCMYTLIIACHAILTYVIVLKFMYPCMHGFDGSPNVTIRVEGSILIFIYLFAAIDSSCKSLLHNIHHSPHAADGQRPYPWHAWTSVWNNWRWTRRKRFIEPLYFICVAVEQAVNIHCSKANAETIKLTNQWAILKCRKHTLADILVSLGDRFDH